MAEQVDLKNNNSFRNYVARDIVRKLDLISYTNQQISFDKRAMFLQEMNQLNDPSQNNVENLYRNYAKSPQKLRKLVLGNIAEQIKLLEKVPGLRNLSDEEVEMLIRTNYRVVATEIYTKAKAVIAANPNLIYNKVSSFSEPSLARKLYINPDENAEPVDFEALYYSIPSDIPENELQVMVELNLGNFINQAQSYRISSDELLSCAEDIVGSFIESFGSLLAIDKIIASKGISAVISTIGKFILKNSGWLTAAVLTGQFSVCLYHANQN